MQSQKHSLGSLLRRWRRLARRSTGQAGYFRPLRLESLEARRMLTGEFTDQGALGLAGVGFSLVAWGDYDNDGDQDALITGLASSTRLCSLYRNTSGTFTDTSANLGGVSGSSVAWGDYL